MTVHSKITPESLLSQRLLIIAPHMDDEILGCGGLILRHKDRSRIHCIYATDGAQSPTPLLSWTGSIEPNIREIRRSEALDVMQNVGIPEDNLVFLDFPDGALARNMTRFRLKLEQELSRINPDIVLVPFRYDLHSDHVAVNRCARTILAAERGNRHLLEYFVYYRWRLIRTGDIRTLLTESNILRVNTKGVASKKSAAVYRYRSQTEILSDWQSQPVLTAGSIADRCGNDEIFLVSNPNESPSKVFGTERHKVIVAHFLQRVGKRRKDQFVALLRWLIRLGRKKDA